MALPGHPSGREREAQSTKHDKHEENEREHTSCHLRPYSSDAATATAYANHKKSSAPRIFFREVRSETRRAKGKPGNTPAARAEQSLFTRP
jgi:hypothetical protein